MNPNAKKDDVDPDALSAGPMPKRLAIDQPRLLRRLSPLGRDSWTADQVASLGPESDFIESDRGTFRRVTLGALLRGALI